MADAKRKPTPAQRRRLDQISRGEITRRGSSWALGFYHSTGCATGGITYTMMCGLHEAGWITADATEREHECVLKLTEAGRAALGVAPAPGIPVPAGATAVNAAEAKRQEQERQRLIADLSYRAAYWRQPGIGECQRKDATEDFARELDRAVAALRASDVQEVGK